MQEIKEIIDVKNLSGGLEILVQLAEKGEIDPWDIDIIDVTNKYLTALDSTPRENLLNAGRAIFFASVLLRLKSEILLNLSNETLLASVHIENFFPEDELLEGQDRIKIDLARLEGYLVRSSLSKQQRKRGISLSDLILALQQAEEEEERRALRAKLKAQNAFTLAQVDIPIDILEITHGEDIEEIVEKVEVIIQEHLTSEKPITLSFLTEILNSKIKAFLALLFLANSQKVVLEQKELYKEVFIHKGGTIIEESITKEVEKATKEKRKKKEPKIIEIITDGNEVKDITVTTPKDESKVINNGLNSAS